MTNEEQARNADEFINRMLVMFGAPETPDPDMFFSEYRAVLKDTSLHLIRAAGDVIRDTHERKSWPVPGEVKSAIRKAGSVIDGKKVRVDDKIVWGNANPAARARVNCLVKECLEALTGPAKEARKADLTAVQQPGFEGSQHARSSGQYLHVDPTRRTLTDRSKAMQGDQA